MAMLFAKLSKFLKGDTTENIAHRLYKSALLIRCYEHNIDYNTEPLKKDIEDICDDLDKMSKGSLERYIKTSMDTQMRSLFEKIEDNSSRFFSRHQRSKETAEIMSEDVGYCPYIAESEVDKKGKGVFMSGRACAGSVVAIFPGVVHLREYVGKKNYLEENLLPDENFFLMRRDDSVMIDARPHTLEGVEIPYNPYGVGHMFNHGSSKQYIKKNAPSANVLQLSYDFPNDTLVESFRFPKNLRPFIPNVYAKEPSMFTSDRSAMMRTVVFIATRPIENGAELLVDYRLKGTDKFPLPEWYPQEDELTPEEDDMTSGKDSSKEPDLVDKYLL